MRRPLLIIFDLSENKADRKIKVGCFIRDRVFICGRFMLRARKYYFLPRSGRLFVGRRFEYDILDGKHLLIEYVA